MAGPEPQESAPRRGGVRWLQESMKAMVQYANEGRSLPVTAHDRVAAETDTIPPVGSPSP
jgi:hypothetical protein